MRRCLRDPMFSRFDTIPECDRHTHTHTHTDTRRRHIPRLARRRAVKIFHGYTTYIVKISVYLFAFSCFVLMSVLCMVNEDVYTDILWRVFHVLTEPVSYTFVSENRRNNEARAYIAMWAGFIISGSVKIWKIRHK